MRCIYADDIATGQDALALDQYGGAQVITTNPPYTRPPMHALGGAGAETHRHFLLF